MSEERLSDADEARLQHLAGDDNTSDLFVVERLAIVKALAEISALRSEAEASSGAMDRVRDMIVAAGFPMQAWLDDAVKQVLAALAAERERREKAEQEVAALRSGLALDEPDCKTAIEDGMALCDVVRGFFLPESMVYAALAAGFAGECPSVSQSVLELATRLIDDRDAALRRAEAAEAKVRELDRKLTQAMEHEFWRTPLDAAARHKVRIVDRAVVSVPGDAIKVERIILSDEAKRSLTTTATSISAEAAAKKGGTVEHKPLEDWTCPSGHRIRVYRPESVGDSCPLCGAMPNAAKKGGA